MNYSEHLSDTQTCVVAFASGDHENVVPHVPNYEFAATLAGLGCSYVLMRDDTEAWYENGVRGIGDKTATIAYVRALTARYPRVITTGVSWGAWGALLYGQSAPVHRMVVFSPLTVVGPSAEAELPVGWHHRIKSERDLDLKLLFPDGPIPQAQAFVSDGDGAELDEFMAKRLGLPTTLIPGHTHGGLARYMRDTGWFERLFV